LFNKTIAIASGAMNLTRNMKTDNNALERLAPCDISSFTFFRPKNHPTKTDIKKPPIGRNKLAEIQSIKSKKFNPNIRKEENSPTDKEQRMPRKEIKSVDRIVEALLLMLNASLK